MDGPSPALPTPSAGDMKFHLQTVLDAKERQVQQAGALGQRLLAQQMELEERIRQLNDIDDDEEIGAQTKELAQTIHDWDAETAQLSASFGDKHVANGKAPSPAPHTSSLPRDEQDLASDRSKAPTAASQSRRAKNAAHRANDVEFAFEIGSGLLTEVRRLQSLLGERDKAIQDMKEEKDDQDKTLENLRTALRQQEQSSDKYKEENWNLEVALQELRTQLSDSQSSTIRLEGEHKRLSKALAKAQEATDTHKNESERLSTALADLKSRHETDVALSRKQQAGLQRDKSDLQTALDNAKAEAARAARRLPRYGSPATPDGRTPNDFLTPAERAEDDPFTGAASTNRRRGDTAAHFPADAFNGEDFGEFSPDPSPSRPFMAANHPANEMEALQQRLAHAHRQINTLKSTLQREKEAQGRYRKKFGALPDEEKENRFDESEGADDDEDEAEELGNRSKGARGTPYRTVRGRGRGRGRGGMTLQQRLGMAAASPGSEWEDMEDTARVDADTPPPPVPAIPLRFQDNDPGAPMDEEELAPSESNRGSMVSLEQSNRGSVVSVDGMDPAYANVLRRSGSASSPLRNVIMARSRRGGVPYQEPRPSSLVGPASALAAELGIGNTSIAESESTPAKEFAEFACQTELVEEKAAEPAPAPAPVPVAVKPETAEMAIQVEPEPVAEVVKAEASAQTDAPMAVSTSVETEAPSAPVHAEMATSPIKAARDSAVLVGGAAIVADRDHEERSRRDTLVQADVSNRSGDATIGRAGGRSFLTGPSEAHSGDETETGVETETDMEDYHDASQSLAATPSNQSVATFHSLQTMTENNYAETDDDAESIKASRQPSRQSGIIAGGSRRRVGSRTAPPTAFRSSKVLDGQIVWDPPEKPEVKEMSVQTDEWTPPAPAATPTPFPAGFARAGAPGGQQFQFVSPPPSAGPNTSTTPTPAGSNPYRDSNATFRPRTPRTSQHDRRQSIESVVSSVLEDGRTDKARPPPMMVLPPPPRQPPPPNSMPPPAFIPERRQTTSTGSRDIPPPRPSSPPPAELIQRATTPTFGSVLSIPNRMGSARQHGSSVPSNQVPLRQLSSTSSFRSAANAAAYAQQSLRDRERRGMSTTSLANSDRSMASPRSSMSSDHPVFANRSNLPPPGNAPTTPPEKTGVADLSQRTVTGGSTDPMIIHSITQTMIGEFLYKYTRRTIGKGYGEKRHKRFFWVHPYTKTLYWSSADPGSSNVSESSAKSAYIEGVRSVLDPNPMPPGLYQYSVVVSTPQREMKFTAPTKERHDIWLNALKYLLARPTGQMMASPANGAPSAPTSPMSVRSEFMSEQPEFSSPQSQRSGRSANVKSWNTTPRGKRSRSQLSVGGSVGKRSGTPAHEYLRWAPESPYSPAKSFEHVQGPEDDEDLDFELHGENNSDGGFEGLENVRACCNGKHTVGRHHHHHHQHSQDSNDHTGARPISPSGWSLRSRTQSANSHDGGTGIFSWGRNEEGKLRFGSRRSTKTSHTAVSAAQDS